MFVDVYDPAVTPAWVLTAIVLSGHDPVIVMSAPATSPGVDVPVPPYAIANGVLMVRLPMIDSMLLPLFHSSCDDPASAPPLLNWIALLGPAAAALMNSCTVDVTDEAAAEFTLGIPLGGRGAIRNELRPGRLYCFRVSGEYCNGRGIVVRKYGEDCVSAVGDWLGPVGVRFGICGAGGVTAGSTGVQPFISG
jgi:hypothetical protein